MRRRLSMVLAHPRTNFRNIAISPAVVEVSVLPFVSCMASARRADNVCKTFNSSVTFSKFYSYLYRFAVSEGGRGYYRLRLVAFLNISRGTSLSCLYPLCRSYLRTDINLPTCKQLRQKFLKLRMLITQMNPIAMIVAALLFNLYDWTAIDLSVLINNYMLLAVVKGRKV